MASLIALVISFSPSQVSAAPDNLQWWKTWGGSSDDGVRGVAVGSDGIYVAGLTGGALPGHTSSGGDDAFLVKFVQPAPAPVGGIAFPADKLALFTPWIILAALIAIVTVSVAVYWRRLST